MIFKNNIITNKKRDLVEESIKVRGLAAAIQSMSFPNFKNLNDLLNKIGYKLVKIENDANFTSEVDSF